MNRLLLLPLIFASCAATCARSERSTTRQQEVLSIDAGIRIEERTNTEVNRVDTHVTGPVEVDRTVEVFNPVAAPDGGLIPVLSRRTVTKVQKASVTSTSETAVRQRTLAEVTAQLEELRKKVIEQQSALKVERDVGLSLATKIYILISVVVAAYLLWRFRAHL